jgi:lichenan operon transcriptional antiterminator
MVDEMISRKHSIIIKYLTEKSEYVTAVELSNQIEASVRTVKRYIKDLNYYLNKDGVEIASIKGIGYKLEGPAKEIKRVSEEADKFIEGIHTDDSIEGRITKALCIFLNSEYVNAEELSEKLNLSIPSTNKLVSNVKDILKNYDLKIISKPHHGSKIVGEEIKIRALILDYAIRTNENDFIEVRLNNISTKEIEHIERIITETLKHSNIIISDKDFNELLTRIIVSISRIRSNQTLDKDIFIDSYIVDSYDLVKKIMLQISAVLNINVEEMEIQYVSSSSGIIAYNYNTGKSLFKDSEDKINKFVDETLQELSFITGVDFREDIDFINAFIMHIKIFINRFRAGVKAKNPLLSQIKSKFPMETNLATIVGKKLEEQFSASLDEDEIGFIAMHFGAAFERLRDKGGRKVCIICHYGIGTSRLLAEKLKRRISDITIVGTYPVRYLDVAIEQDIDFVVSTVKLDTKDFKIPVLYIENVFSDEIINELNQIFSEKDQRKSIFRNTFNKEAFFRIHAETREEAIKSLGREMKAKKFIDDEVIAKVFERENMSSTDIGHLVAIPHTILDGKYKSIIGVGVLEKPIIWNKQEVQLIFMVCFNRKESHNFPVFKYLYNFIEDEGNVKRAIKVLSFEKFMEILDEK